MWYRRRGGRPGQRQQRDSVTRRGRRSQGGAVKEAQRRPKRRRRVRATTDRTASAPARVPPTEGWMEAIAATAGKDIVKREGRRWRRTAARPALGWPARAQTEASVRERTEAQRRPKCSLARNPTNPRNRDRPAEYGRGIHCMNHVSPVSLFRGEVTERRGPRWATPTSPEAGVTAHAQHESGG